MKRDFYDLMSKLVLFRHNVQVLHWSCKGEEFGQIHDNLTNEIYSFISDDIDVVAEMIIRVGLHPLSFTEVFSLMKTHNYIEVKSGELYNKEDTYKELQRMFVSIIESIEALLETDEINSVKNSGIRSELENMHNRYDVERRFKNFRRML